MKRIISADLAFAVLYIVLGGILCHKGALTLKAVVSVTGISILAVGGAVFFFSTSLPARRLGAATAVAGGAAVIFCPFFINLSLLACGGAIATWGVLCCLKNGSLVAVGDTVIGAMLILSVFVLKKLLLPICAVLMIACAVVRLLRIIGVCDY